MFRSNYLRIQKQINTVQLSLKYEQLKLPEIHPTLIKPLTDEILLEKTPDLIFILLLLRYEYLIQSENNLINYDLLITKANICELLSIRMLREYNSTTRIEILFQNPLASINPEYKFNLLELSVLSKSKKFLSQPIIIRILDRLYNGEIILNNGVEEEKGLLDISNYKFEKISFRHICKRARTVPKYQSIVINIKLIVFSLLYFLQINYKYPYTEILFWLFTLSFNIELLTKLVHIEWTYMKLIIWNYIDILLICLLDTCLILKLTSYYSDVFSLIGIILFPRILSILNNYKFFNLIVLSLNKMIWNLFGLTCFFFTLISGFYFSFITLSINQSNGEILFNMVKIFFGFTPSVWNNWEKFNTLGKVLQMGYLFLIQFIIGTILAICLSSIFAKIRESNFEEFNYFKTKNLILYFKSANLNNTLFLNIFKFPIYLGIFIYELILSKFYKESNDELKNFTFIKDNLKNWQSFNTIHYRTASTDSFFINEILNKKYGTGNNNTNKRIITNLSKRGNANGGYSYDFNDLFKKPIHESSTSKFNRRDSETRSVLIYDIQEDIIPLTKKNTVNDIDQYDSDETI
ncbi:unnamed protein product [Candida verbasci]|uniref:Calcium channel YVC1-like C-terminal transmembrane domain-containing protein n=1 Tax=Candida verbasci TaxID=1227364 RepID=A0A9W4XB43_9ASCO|nr:unnamed protein product [Candida verbasci]